MNTRLDRYSDFEECHSEEQSDEESRWGWRREILHLHSVPVQNDSTPHLHHGRGLQFVSRRAIPSLCLYLVFYLYLSSPAFAGHGFSSTFTNIEWLPEPGRTPDSVLYRLDATQEEGKLLFAQTNEEKVRLCLTFAREKLAELEAMVKAEKADAAKTAAERYRLYVDRAQQLTVESTNDKESLADMMANAFLEHQYILSVIYEELPASTRTVVTEVIAAAQEKYQAVTKLLSPKKKGALFFKEEEVRWSVQMATRTEEDSRREAEGRSQ